MYFIICVIAVLIDCIVGDPKKWTHPVIYIGNMISFSKRNGIMAVAVEDGSMDY